MRPRAGARAAAFVAAATHVAALHPSWDLQPAEAWDPSRYIAYAARVGALPQDDADALVELVRQAAGPTGKPFLLSVTTAGMVDLAQNMLRSLDTAPSTLPRVVIGMGDHVCKDLGTFWNTRCIEIYKDSVPEDEVAWGTEDYYKVVLRKHVILSIVSLSGLSRGLVFSDPDIVYFRDPAEAFSELTEDYDVTFSPNNYLEPQANSVEDLAEDYDKRGMANILLGTKGRHVDINTGLFYMQNSTKVNRLWMETLKIFVGEAGKHGHYQQYALVNAMDRLPDVRIGVGPGDVFANGNVFWGHRELLQEGRLCSVHANWMQSSLKRTCLDAAGLWIDPDMAAGTLLFSTSADSVDMDERAATVTKCSVARHKS